MPAQLPVGFQSISRLEGMIHFILFNVGSSFFLLALNRSNFERERTWERVVEGFARGRPNVCMREFNFFNIAWPGKCILTLGTGTNPHITWEDVQFLSSHSYAVIGISIWNLALLADSYTLDESVTDVTESGDGRILTILDTWVNPSHEKQVQEPRGALPINCWVKTENCWTLSKALRVPWLDVLNVFDGIYLSWDPCLWENQLIFHR